MPPSTSITIPSDALGILCNLIAYNASTGVRLWTVDAGSDFSTFTPAVANGVVYAGTVNGGGMQAYSEKTGSLLYRGTLTTCRNPVVSHSHVFATCSGPPDERTLETSFGLE